MSSRLWSVFAGTVAVVALAASAHGANILWKGSSNDYWSVGTNWNGGVAPSNPSTDTPYFDGTDLGGTNIVDPENLSSASNTWTIGGLTLANPTNGGYTISIGTGDTLVVNGALTAWQYSDTVTHQGLYTIVTGAVFQVGTAGQKADLTVAKGTGSSWMNLQGTLTVACQGFQGYLRDLTVGYRNLNADYTEMGVLDLRGTPIVGGTLQANNIYVGWKGRDGGSYIQINEGCALQALQARTNLYIGYFGNDAAIGNPANNYSLPTNVSVIVGQDAANRGAVIIGQGGQQEQYSASGWQGKGRLVAATGGTFTAYLTGLTVGYSSFDNANARGYGILDVRGMSNVLIDVSGTTVFGEATGANGCYTATGRFARATINTGNLRVGVGGLGTRSGFVELDGTVATVTNNVTVGTAGRLNVRLNGAAAGVCLSNADASAFAITVGGVHDLNFVQDQSGGETGVYWALRWKGDHKSALYAMHGDGRLSWTSAVPSKTVGVLYDTNALWTYVTISNSWPPTAVARDRTFPVYSPTQRVVVTVGDIDGGSFDANTTIVSRTISCPQDQDLGDTNVTLVGANAYVVTLTVSNALGASDSAACTVTLFSPAATAGDVIWSGGSIEADTWSRGENWSGGVAPTNPTAGVLTFANVDMTTNIVNPGSYFGYTNIWAVGGLIYANTLVGGHTTVIDAGRTLLVNGALSAWFYSSAINGLSATITGGVLQVGTSTQSVDFAVVRGTSGNWGDFIGTLKIACEGFRPYIRDLCVGYRLDTDNAD